MRHEGKFSVRTARIYSYLSHTEYDEDKQCNWSRRYLCITTQDARTSCSTKFGCHHELQHLHEEVFLQNKANVAAIWKGKGSKTEAANYRSISVLSVLDRLFKRAIARQ